MAFNSYLQLLLQTDSWTKIVEVMILVFDRAEMSPESPSQRIMNSLIALKIIGEK